ncbi:AGE family epimerase/isomerase [Desertivirga brevis]|uniref:AGE family epimerase/isomerase n=1 Tax=Desertivirga brevis TaxID=2810310 RepID=UPI001A96934A|nr:AGE family epimerase/isomerase [Pedobacter sp. SYSU D00873]
MDFNRYSSIYLKNLVDEVLPFWLKNSPDKEYGGFFTCLDTEGRVFDTDKFIWLQARQVWTFSMLYNQMEKNPLWLETAIHGAEFLKKHGRDSAGNWYFSLSREGAPLVQPYNIFSDCFATMAFAQLYKASGVEEYREISVNTFFNILKRQDNPKGKFSKAFPGTRELQNFSLPMILSNLVLEIEHVLDPAIVEATIDKGIHTVMEVFYQPDSGLILENVYADGSFSDSFEGRLLNPGHVLEAMWFVMDLATRRNDQKLIEKAVNIAINALEYGWDKEFGGILYFLDIKGNPPQQLEWDQKLWWVHAEAIVCMLKGYEKTGDQRCLNWFKKLHEYTWKNFVDEDNGEWFGYLNRRGEVLLPLKGGKWKGCFHVPRALFLAQGLLKTLAEKEDKVLSEM